MANTADVKAIITAEDRASNVLKGFGDNIENTGNKLAGVTSIITKGLEVASAAAVGFGVLSIRSFMESQDVQAQLNSALTSTHHAAGLYLEDLNDQSAALQRVTKFSDEQVGAAQAMLLTFTNIHGAVYQQSIPAILDLATAMHEDLQSASIQVGKALNDPVLGITALHRIGVTFSETQKQQIQGFVDTNNLAAAQGVILKELNKEFGGSAVAAGNTFAGSLAKLKNSLDDVQETVGKTLINALNPFLQRLASTVSSQQFQANMTNVVRVLIDFFNVMAKIIPILMDMFSWLEKHKVILAALGGIVGGILVTSFVAWSIAAYTAAAATIAATWPILAIGAAIGTIAYLAITHWNDIKNAFIAGKDVIVNIASILIAPYRFAFNEIARLWNNTIGKLHFTLPSWIPGIGGKGFDVPDIPMLAEGGIVTRPTLAMIGEAGAEAVIPLNKAGGAGVGSTINITVQAGAFMGSQQDARQYAMAILKSLKDAAAAKNTTVSNLIGVNP